MALAPKDGLEHTGGSMFTTLNLRDFVPSETSPRQEGLDDKGSLKDCDIYSWKCWRLARVSLFCALLRWSVGCKAESPSQSQTLHVWNMPSLAPETIQIHRSHGVSGSQSGLTEAEFHLDNQSRLPTESNIKHILDIPYTIYLS